VNEIAPGLFHWETFHTGIGARVSSYYAAASGTLIDPRGPEEGLAWFRAEPPQRALLTNRHHFRHAREFRREYEITVHVHRAGMHEFAGGEPVLPFEWGTTFPGGARALRVASLCDEETAFHLEPERALALGDSVVREGFEGELAFVDDELMGDDPARVKVGLLAALEPLPRLEWDHLLLAHGAPWRREGREALAAFVARGEEREAA